MPAAGDLLEVFSAERPRLMGLAYRMLGSVTDAEDIVQEAWIRWQRSDRAAVERPGAWLTTVTTRLALDQARARARHRAEYIGPWLPEPLVGAIGLEESAEMADSLAFGFVVLLDRLAPHERAVFILADVFSVPYRDIALAMGKSADACRQIASRARRKVRGRGPPSSPAADRRLLDGLMTAFAAGDIGGVMERLAPDVTYVADGGASRRAARHPVVGAERVARLMANLIRRYVDRVTVTPAVVNGGAGLLLRMDEVVDQVLAFETDGSTVTAIRAVRNPAKLLRIGGPIEMH